MNVGRLEFEPIQDFIKVLGYSELSYSLDPTEKRTRDNGTVEIPQEWLEPCNYLSYLCVILRGRTGARQAKPSLSQLGRFR